MIAVLIVFGLMAVIALLILVSVKIIAFINNYKIFQSRDDDFFDYAVIDYSTLKRLYQVNPDGYELTGFGQLYRMNNNNGWTRELRIVFKTIFDYLHFEIDKKYNKKASQIAKRRKQEEQGLSKLRDLAQQDIDNLRTKLDAEFEQEKKKLKKLRRICSDYLVVLISLASLMVTQSIFKVNRFIQMNQVIILPRTESLFRYPERKNDGKYYCFS